MVEHLANRLQPRPAFARLLGLADLEEAVADLLSRGASVDEIGRSREGRPLSHIRIGSGPLQALWYAGPHANEPVGGNTVIYLADWLMRHGSKGFEEWTFHIVPCIDPDALARNDGWLTQPMTPDSYYRHLYRPAEGEWPDWDMPISHPGLSREPRLPEGQALQRLIDDVRPDFLYALHNGEVGGAFCYVAGPSAVADPLSRWLSHLGLPLAGPPLEDPTVATLAPGVFGLPDMRPLYDELLRTAEGDPSTLLRRGESAPHYAHASGAVALLTEVPYWTHHHAGSVGAERPMADVVSLASEQLGEFTEAFAATIEEIAPFLTLDGPLRRSVLDGPGFLARLRAGLELAIPTLDRPAPTEVAAETQFVTAVSLPQRYRGMLLQLLDAELAIDPDCAPLASAQRRTAQEFDQTCRQLGPEVLQQHDVNLLVTAQVGAGLLAQQALVHERETAGAP